MKNIHVLPTENSSRLSYNKDGVLELHRLQWRKNTQNIYITSDEEIKEREWCTDGIYLIQATPKLVDAQGLFDRRDWRKIILTTDQELIKDGVQAIDDKFLEWFVKNQSCEFVEIKQELGVCLNCEWNYDSCPNAKECLKGKYKIIIPKEEPKLQCKDCNDNLTDCTCIENTVDMNKIKIYLDDVRTPVDPTWKVVRNYEQFVDQITYYGLENIDIISLDHDLGPSAMAEWHSNVYHNYELNYDNIEEKTGMDCTKWLVEQWLDGAPVVDVVIHSANAVGSANMMGYINNYRHIHRLPQNCVRVQIEHTV